MCGNLALSARTGQLLSLFRNDPRHLPTNSSVLEGADPAAYLREALEATFAQAVGMWARHTVRPLGE